MKIRRSRRDLFRDRFLSGFGFPYTYSENSGSLPHRTTVAISIFQKSTMQEAGQQTARNPYIPEISVEHKRRSARGISFGHKSIQAVPLSPVIHPRKLPLCSLNITFIRHNDMERRELCVRKRVETLSNTPKYKEIRASQRQKIRAVT